MPKRTLLIVDDHDVLRGLLETQLQEWFDDIQVRSAADGETAVKMAEDLHPDLVIMDITLPGMNGIEATRQIKKKLSDTPVVILSVHELEAYQEDARNAGANAFVPKRLMRTDLCHVLEELLVLKAGST